MMTPRTFHFPGAASDALMAWREQGVEVPQHAQRHPQFLEREVFSHFVAQYTRLQALPRRVRRAMQRHWRQSLAGVAVLLALSGEPALAATIHVNGTTCTLVDAIRAANADTARGGCRAGRGADTLVLAAGSTHTLFGPTGLPLINSRITINGNGSTIERESSAPAFRIFWVNSGGNLTLRKTTVRGGSGSGVFNAGRLTLINSTIAGNTGGGVYNARDGRLTVSHSTISGNTGNGVHNPLNGRLTVSHSTISDNAGSGVFNGRDSLLTVSHSTISDNADSGVVNDSGIVIMTDSTISGNRSGGVLNSLGGASGSNYAGISIANSTISGNAGGGVFNQGGGITVTNSTISGNSAGDGGGVFNTYKYARGFTIGGDIVITNSTISGNSASGRGGGVFNGPHSSNLILNRTLITGNIASTSPEVHNDTGGPYGSGIVTADNFNLFGLNGHARVTGFSPGATDIVPAAGVRLADILQPTLADNGGVTQTHALPPGSPAVDAVLTDCPPPETDQRGEPRPQGAACDIGALEFAFVCGGQSATIIGTSDDDVLLGTPGDDVIVGLDGHDTIRGGGGNDSICGGRGHDQLLGDTGDDRLFGQEGNDLLMGNLGNDHLVGHTGDDVMNGGQGTDSCIGGGGVGTDSVIPDTCERVSEVP